MRAAVTECPLAAARAVIADLTAHSDPDIAAACDTIIDRTQGEEAARARDLKHLIQGETK